MGSQNRLSETRSMANLRNYLTGPVRKSLLEDVGKAALKDAKKNKKQKPQLSVSSKVHQLNRSDTNPDA